MPAVPSTPRVKLRAATRRVPRVRGTASEPEADAEAEPNMRLSRAILVMLLLHVVAVGGILAFSLIKEQKADRQNDERTSSPASAVEAEESLTPATKPLNRPDAGLDVPKSPTHVVQPGETLLRIANDHGVTVDALVAANGAQTAMSSLRPGQELKLPEKSPEPGSIPAERLPISQRALAPADVEGRTTSKDGRLSLDSGKFYTVGKGESPYVIAQKLKVSYEALIKLNHIDDPKKLKPGQRLLIPLQTAPKSKEG